MLRLKELPVTNQELKQRLDPERSRRLLEVAVHAWRQGAISAAMVVILILTSLGIAGCGGRENINEPIPTTSTAPTPEHLQSPLIKIELPLYGYVMDGVVLNLDPTKIHLRNDPWIEWQQPNLVPLDKISNEKKLEITIKNPIIVEGGTTSPDRSSDWWVVIPLLDKSGRIQVVYAALSPETIEAWGGVPKDKKELMKWLKNRKLISMESEGVEITPTQQGGIEVTEEGKTDVESEIFISIDGGKTPAHSLSPKTPEQQPTKTVEAEKLMPELLKQESQLLKTAIETSLPEPAKANDPESTKRYEESLKKKSQAEQAVISWLEKEVTNNPNLSGKEKVELVRNGFLGVFLPENRLQLFDLMIKLKTTYPNIELFRRTDNKFYQDWLMAEGHNIHPETLAMALRAHEWMMNFVKSDKSEAFLDFIYADVPDENRKILKEMVREHPELFVPSPGALATLMSYETGAKVGQEKGHLKFDGNGKILAGVNIGITPIDKGLKGGHRIAAYGVDGPLNPKTKKERRLLYLLSLAANDYGLSWDKNPYTDSNIPGSAPGEGDASGGAIGPMIMPPELRMMMRAYVHYVQPYTNEPLPSPFDPYDGTKYVLMYLMNMRAGYYQAAYTAIPRKVINDMRQWAAGGKKPYELEVWFQKYNIGKDKQLKLARALSLTFTRKDKVVVPAFDRRWSIVKWNPFEAQINVIINGDNLWREKIDQQKQQGFRQSKENGKVVYEKGQKREERKRLKDQHKRTVETRKPPKRRGDRMFS